MFEKVSRNAGFRSFVGQGRSAEVCRVYERGVDRIIHFRRGQEIKSGVVPVLQCAVAVILSLDPRINLVLLSSPRAQLRFSKRQIKLSGHRLLHRTTDGLVGCPRILSFAYRPLRAWWVALERSDTPGTDQAAQFWVPLPHLVTLDFLAAVLGSSKPETRR